MRTCMSQVQAAQDIFYVLKRLDSSYSVLKCGNNFVLQEPRYGQKCDFTGL